MIYRLFLFLTLSTLSFSISCPKVTCVATSIPEFTAGNDVCTTKMTTATDINFKITKCKKSDQYCNFTYDGNQSFCADKNMVQNYYFPGEPCSSRINCKSIDCQSGSCVGFAKGLSCKYNYECNAGLFCNVSGKCDDQVDSGKPCGDGAAKCKNELVCVNKKCIPIGSLDAGAVSDFAIGCKTLYVALDEFGIMKCAKGPALDWDPLTPCKIGSLCNYTLGDNSKFSLPCRCGNIPTGEGFCNPGVGKMEADIQLFIAYASVAQTPPCHMESPWFCLQRRKENKTEFHKAYAAYTNITYWEVIMKNEDCFKEMFMQDYWESWKIANWRNNTPPSFGMDKKTGGFLAYIIALLILAIALLQMEEVIDKEK